MTGAPAADIAAVARGLVFAANQNPVLQRVFTTFSANTPQLYLDIDRDKVQTLGIEVSDVFSTLQAVLGSAYVNDFNLFGRTWQVVVQGEASDRSKIDDIYRINVRNNKGEMVPVRAFAEARPDPRSAVAHPLQQSAQRHHQWRASARVTAPARRSPRWNRYRPPALPPGLRLRMDRHRAAGEGSQRQDHHHPGAGPAVRLSLPRRPLRELDHPHRGAALRDGRRHGFDAGAEMCRGSTTISTPRSASWC